MSVDVCSLCVCVCVTWCRAAVDGVLRFWFVFKLHQKVVPVLIYCSDTVQKAIHQPSKAFTLKYPLTHSFTVKAGL